MVCQLPKQPREGDIRVNPVRVREAEKEEMWSFVGDKSHQYWLWRAIDRDSGEPSAFHFGTWEHENPDELLALPAPFDIKVIYCDNNYAYRSRVKKSEVKTGKDRKEIPVVEDMVFPVSEEGYSFFQRLSYAQNSCSSRD
jgi:IS1 family transposase